MRKEEALKLKVGDVLVLKKAPMNARNMNPKRNWFSRDDVVTVKHIQEVYGNTRIICNDSTGYFTPGEVSLKGPRIDSRMHLLELKKKKSEAIFNIENEIKEIDNKIAYMDELNLENFDEGEYKIYNVIKVIGDNSDVSDIEKIRSIKKLLSK